MLWIDIRVGRVWPVLTGIKYVHRARGGLGGDQGLGRMIEEENRLGTLIAGYCKE